MKRIKNQDWTRVLQERLQDAALPLETDFASLESRRTESSRRADGNYFSDKFAEKPISDPPSTTPAHATPPVFISESGISDPATVRALRKAGYRGFLMGETFMKNPDPGAALADFIQAL